MTHTPESLAFQRAIAEQPDADTPRLAFADYLDGLDAVRVKCPDIGKHGKHYRCKRCKTVYVYTTKYSDCGSPRCEGEDSDKVDCPTCSGTGTVLDTSRADRAELIRVQVELAKIRPWADPRQGIYTAADGSTKYASSPYFDRWKELDARGSALLAAAHPEWLPPCPLDDGTPEGAALHNTTGLRCGVCNGTRRVGSLTRGFVESVEVPTLASVLQGVWGAISEPHNMEPTPYACTLLAGWPTVTRVFAADRLPQQYPPYIPTSGTPQQYVYGWLREVRPQESFSLPAIIWDALDRTGAEKRKLWLDFPTPDAARVALAEALCRVLRALV